MEIRKQGLVLLLLFLQLHLLPASPYPLQNPLVTADLNEEQNVGNKQMMEKLSTKVGVGREISVNRRGGGGGGHGGHGGHGGRGSHGSGGKANGHGDGQMQGAATFIPLYAAGTMNQHNKNHQHHGANSGTVNYIGLTYLAFILLASLLIHYT